MKKKRSIYIAAELLDKWFSRFGPPQTITTDNENAMIGKAVKRLTHMLGIKGLQTTIYHPQGNAPIETFHRTLKTYLTNLRPQVQKIMTVEEAVSWALMCYRSLPHQGIDDSPAFLTHGRDFRFKPDPGITSGWRKHQPHKSRQSILLEIRAELLRRNAYRLKHNKDRKLETPVLEVGQIVLIQLAETQWVVLSKLIGTRKLMPKWSLPMRVLHISGNGNTVIFDVLISGYTTQVHADRCRLIDPPATQAMREEWMKVCSS